MKFSLKVFIVILSIVAIMLAVSGTLIMRHISSRMTEEYISRYQNFSKQIGGTLAQIDNATDSTMIDALYVLREREKTKGLPSNSDLMKLKNELGVGGIYITDSQGRYLRSDLYILIGKDPHLKAIYSNGSPLSKSLFSYCEKYRDLVAGQSTIEKTPIIPSGNATWKWPYKFMMIPNYNRTRILEVDMAMQSIGDILRNVMEPDPNIMSVALFTPSGQSLGYVYSRGESSRARVQLDERNESFLHPQDSERSLVFTTKILAGTGDCCECRIKGLTLADGTYYYVLRTEVSKDALKRELADIRRWMLRMGIVALIVCGSIAYIMSHRLVQKLSWMGERIKEIAESNNLNLRLHLPGRDEVALLAGKFDDMLERLKISQSRLAAAEKEKALVELARQVAHDIRSPLAALEVASGDAANLPEERRVLIRRAAARIRDIANILLMGRREARAAAGGVSMPGPEPAVPCLLSSLIDSLISEKRMQYRSKIGIEIEAGLDAASYGLFAEVQPAQFKRVLSNLINNSVEALAEKGAVTVSLSSKDDKIVLDVRDNGRGIRPEIMAKLGCKGESHGKPGGSGLGLYHARTSAESWGGTLTLQSQAGEGTTATLFLPRAPVPGWFVSELVLNPRDPVVVLDDDTTIHQIWRERLSGLRTRGRDIRALHFSTPQELRQWTAGNPQNRLTALYLLDYELLGCDETGLSLAEDLGIGERTILVTSRYEEPGILEGCQRLKVRMIPKGLAGLVPIRMQAIAPGQSDIQSVDAARLGMNNTGINSVPPGPAPKKEIFDAVLIDDDPLVHLNWKIVASKMEKRLRYYASIEEFLAQSRSIDCRTPVYIDVELGNGIRGDREALKIAELGFKDIYLATGHEAEHFADLKHVRAIVGKAPPWRALEPASSRNGEC